MVKIEWQCTSCRVKMQNFSSKKRVTCKGGRSKKFASFGKNDKSSHICSIGLTIGIVVLNKCTSSYIIIVLTKLLLTSYLPHKTLYINRITVQRQPIEFFTAQIVLLFCCSIVAACFHAAKIVCHYSAA